MNISTKQNDINAHLVRFDTGINPIRIQSIDKRCAIRARLVKSFLEKDRATDMLTQIRGGDQKLTVATTVFLVVFDANSFEAGATGRIDSSIARIPLPGWVILVCGRGALKWCHANDVVQQHRRYWSSTATLGFTHRSREKLIVIFALP